MSCSAYLSGFNQFFPVTLVDKLRWHFQKSSFFPLCWKMNSFSKWPQSVVWNTAYQSTAKLKQSNNWIFSRKLLSAIFEIKDPARKKRRSKQKTPKWSLSMFNTESAPFTQSWKHRLQCLFSKNLLFQCFLSAILLTRHESKTAFSISDHSACSKGVDFFGSRWVLFLKQGHPRVLQSKLFSTTRQFPQNDSISSEKRILNIVCAEQWSLHFLLMTLLIYTIRIC